MPTANDEITSAYNTLTANPLGQGIVSAFTALTGIVRPTLAPAGSVPSAAQPPGTPNSGNTVNLVNPNSQTTVPVNNTVGFFGNLSTPAKIGLAVAGALVLFLVVKKLA